MGKDANRIMELKEELIKFSELIKRSQKEEILVILQKELPQNKIQDFEEDFASVMFFRNIYDKTDTYFSNLINKIYSELSYLLTILDKKITLIQKEEQEEQKRQQELLEKKMEEERLRK